MDWEFGRHLFSLALKITDIFSVFMVLFFFSVYMELFSFFFKGKTKPTYLFSCFLGCARVLVAACRIFSGNMWDLVPWPGIEHWPPTLGAQSLNHWTTREVSESFSVLALSLSFSSCAFKICLCCYVYWWFLSVSQHCMIYMAACLPIHPLKII